MAKKLAPLSPQSAKVLKLIQKTGLSVEKARTKGIMNLRARIADIRSAGYKVGTVEQKNTQAVKYVAA